MSRIISALAFLILSSSFAQADSNWPRWRGPMQDGHSSETGFPSKWDDSKVSWKADLPGIGQSSPTIWEHRIFMTAALENGRERVVFCVDRTNGKILWQKSVWTGEPESTHKMNGWATPTCATDGEHVYAFFGKGGGLFCLTLEGELRWSKPLGEFTGPWGTAACPVLVDDLVIQNCDSDGEAFLVAFNKVTGEQAWRVPRESNRCWSTPILIQTKDRAELVLQGHTGVRSYNPATGKELWKVTGSSGRGTPTVTYGAGLLFVVPGRPGETYALKTGGNGDITASHKQWKVKRSGRDLPSPIVMGEFVLIMNHRGGILSCYRAATGEELWQERIGGTFSSSPVAFDGLAAFISDEGNAIVVKPGETANIVSTNTLTSEDDEIFRASITPSGGELFIRSTKRLYCVSK